MSVLVALWENGHVFAYAVTIAVMLWLGRREA